jgi:DNA-binding CsgD family transcriptional regulator
MARIYSELCRPNTDIFHGVMVTGTLPEQGLFSLGIHAAGARPRLPLTPTAGDDADRHRSDSDLQLDLQGLKALFAFTSAEARLVSLLVSGGWLPDVANELGIGFETARTHLARARAKTETTSRIDLVRSVLLAMSPLRASSH